MASALPINVVARKTPLPLWGRMDARNCLVIPALRFAGICNHRIKQIVAVAHRNKSINARRVAFSG